MSSEEQITRFNLDYFDLSGKVAIVTGANQGLGMAYAVAFAKAGADLYIPHLTDDVDDIKRLIETEGRQVKFLQGDLTDRGYITQIVDDCVKEYGRIDILLNNSGIGPFHDFEDYPDRLWQKTLDLNLSAMYYLSHEASRVMRDQGSGKIINIGSALSYTSDKRCPPYTTTKHAVLGLTKVFANELGQYNIQTNAICPGFLATDVNAELRKDPSFTENIDRRLAAGRWGNLDDLMGAVIFLASKASDYINGTDLNIDGGFAATC